MKNKLHQMLNLRIVMAFIDTLYRFSLGMVKSNTRYTALILVTLLHLLITSSVEAQSPLAIPYQAIARDMNGSVLSNQSIGLRITLIDSNINLIDYQETHQVTTNALGLFTLNIGQGTPLFGTFSAISWPISGNEHIQVDMDATGGTNYTNMGITKLNSVPFALHANTSSDNKWNANGSSVYNNNSGNVGIGTSSPGAKLDVNGMAFFRNNAGGFVTGGGTGVKISTENNKGGIFGFDYTNFTPIDLILQGEGANVGIGNHFPESTLHITKPNDATTLIIGGNSQAGQFTALRLQTSASQGGYSNIQSIKYSGYDFGDLILNKDGGNIGIGTATPSAKLEVAGNVKIADGTQGSGKILTSDANGMATWQSPSGTVETDPKVGTLANNTIPTWNGTSLANGTITDITNKIGIGTSSPSEQLHTTGGVRHESLGGSSKRPVYADANGKLSAGNDTLVSSTLTTNISYSFTNLFSPLSLLGLPASINPKDLSIEVHGLNNDAISVFLQAPNGDVLNLFNTAYSSFNALFSDEASTIAPTNSSNYSGSYKPTGSLTPLGSINPTVSTFASMGGGTINPNGTWTLIVIVQPSFLGFNLDNWSISYHNAQLAQGSNHYVPLWENGNLSIASSLYDNGNVGIHTTSPQRSLDVHGDIAQGVWTDNLPSRRIGVMDASTHVAGMEIENTTLSGNYSQKLHLLTHHYANGFGRRFTIDEDGKVGIGTQTPQAKLDIVGNIKIADGTQSQGAILTSDANGQASWTASVGCVIRADTWSSPASGTGYTTGVALSPTFMYSSGIFGDTRLINPNGAFYDISTFPNLSGVFTAPAEGYYELSIKVISVASNARLLILASLNGAAPIEIFDVITSNNCAQCSDVSHTQIMYLNAGDKHRVLRSANSIAINSMIISYRKL